MNLFVKAVKGTALFFAFIFLMIMMFIVFLNGLLHLPF